MKLYGELVELELLFAALWLACAVIIRVWRAVETWRYWWPPARPRHRARSTIMRRGRPRPSPAPARTTTDQAPAPRPKLLPRPWSKVNRGRYGNP